MSQASFKPSAFLAPRYWPTWLAIGVLRLTVLLPYGWQRRLGRALGAGFYHLHHKRRHVARVNIALCFPELDAAEREALVKDAFRHTGIGAFETALAWWGDTEQLRECSRIEGLHHLHQALEQGRGVILLTGHSTSMEMGGRLLSMQGPMQVMYRTLRNPLFDAVALQGRRKYCVRVVPRTELRATVRGLKENLPTWYAPDQDFGARGSVFADFMGVPTATLLATARLARMSGAKVVPFYPYRQPGSTGFKVVVEPALEGFPSGDDHADASRINAVLGKQIARAPAQYLWVHQRFKTRPPGAPDLY